MSNEMYLLPSCPCHSSVMRPMSFPWYFPCAARMGRPVSTIRSRSTTVSSSTFCGLYGFFAGAWYTQPENMAATVKWPWQRLHFYTEGDMPWKSVWLLMHAGFVAVSVTLLLQNAARLGDTPPIATVTGIVNLFVYRTPPYVGVTTGLSSVSFAEDARVLSVGAQDVPVAPDSCMLARKGMPREYKETAVYGNRQIVVVNGIHVSENACREHAVPTDGWGDPLACGAQADNDWAHFMCAASTHRLAIHCPQWQALTEKPCEQNIKCCDRTRVMYNEKVTRIAPYVMHGVMYLTLVDEA